MKEDGPEVLLGLAKDVSERADEWFAFLVGIQIDLPADARTRDEGTAGVPGGSADSRVGAGGKPFLSDGPFQGCDFLSRARMLPTTATMAPASTPRYPP